MGYRVLQDVAPAARPDNAVLWCEARDLALDVVIVTDDTGPYGHLGDAMDSDEFRLSLSRRARLRLDAERWGLLGVRA